jgi:hypothetical protein
MRALTETFMNKLITVKFLYLPKRMSSGGKGKNNGKWNIWEVIDVTSSAIETCEIER